MEETRHCPFCDEEVRAKAVKCKHCNEPIEPGICMKCRKQNRPGARFCGWCGSDRLVWPAGGRPALAVSEVPPVPAGRISLRPAQMRAVKTPPPEAVQESRPASSLAPKSEAGAAVGAVPAKAPRAGRAVMVIAGVLALLLAAYGLWNLKRAVKSAQQIRQEAAESAQKVSPEMVKPAQQVRSEAVKSVSRSGKADIEWVSLPGGSFMMGSEENSDEKPMHSVTVKAFQMAKTEVTNKQYKACVAAGACKAASDYSGFSGDDNPVVGVGWNDAKAFSEWVGGRLPSEAQWEYAARSAGKDRKYPWGDEDATCERAVISGCSSSVTLPVCSKTRGNTEQGLCDMAGNAWEWTQDWYHSSYAGAPSDGSALESPTGSYRVVRGGSWDGGASGARAADRGDGDPANRNGYVSFRPVR